MAASLPTLDERTGAMAGEYHSEYYKPMDTIEQAADTLEAANTMYQLDGRQEVHFSQDGGALMARDAMIQTWANASGAHADIPRMHNFRSLPVIEHHGVLPGRYNRVQSFGLEELNSGTLENSESRHEHQQKAGDSSLGNDQHRVILTFPEGEDDVVTITERDMEGLQPTQFLGNNMIDFYIKHLKGKLPPEEEKRLFFFNSYFLRKTLGEQQ